MVWDGIDKRRFPRIKYECIIKMRKTASPHIITTQTQNIGVGGICVLLNEKINLFEKVEIELLVEKTSKPISCAGSVVWVIERSWAEKESPQFDTGIEFLKLKEEDRGRIDKIVRDFSES
jgi:hypothetical protein